MFVTSALFAVLPLLAAAAPARLGSRENWGDDKKDEAKEYRESAYPLSPTSSRPLLTPTHLRPFFSLISPIVFPSHSASCPMMRRSCTDYQTTTDGLILPTLKTGNHTTDLTLKTTNSQLGNMTRNTTIPTEQPGSEIQALTITLNTLLRLPWRTLVLIRLSTTTKLLFPGCREGLGLLLSV